MPDIEIINAELAELDHAIRVREQQGELLRLELERSRAEREEMEARTEKTRQEARGEARQHALEMALHSVKCLDVPAAARVFADQVTHNAAGEIVFIGEHGKHYPLADGLAAEMPDYWRPPLHGGGSGTRSGNVRSQPPRNTALDREREKLAQLKHQYHLSGGLTTILNQWSKQRNIVSILEQQAAIRKR